MFSDAQLDTDIMDYIWNKYWVYWVCLTKPFRRCHVLIQSVQRGGLGGGLGIWSDSSFVCTSTPKQWACTTDTTLWSGEGLLWPKGSKLGELGVRCLHWVGKCTVKWLLVLLISRPGPIRAIQSGRFIQIGPLATIWSSWLQTGIADSPLKQFSSPTKDDLPLF